MKQTLDWQKYLDTAAQAVAEGIVMLCNEKAALPLPDGEPVALFGRTQLHYYKSGTGSGGMVNVAKVTGILEGLEEAGVTVYAPLLETYRKWDDAHPYDLGSGWGAEPWSQEEMPLSDAAAADAAAQCSRAVCVIGRTAGEEQDNRLAPGSYLLTDTETAMLRTVRRHFKKMIVLLNVGNLIDMQWMDDIKPDAVLYVWQGGMTGGTGTAAVLTGAQSPSGKLPDTIAYSIEDYPSHLNFGDRENNTYAEDIYVGYRYFETFAQDRVRYPFGFGMSYTTFDIAAKADGSRITAAVTNTGKYAGKEVVQIYCEAPQGTLGKPFRELIAYRKTAVLQPGESETLTLDVTLPAHYDEKSSAWVREAGEYRLYAGSDVRRAACVGSVTLKETELVQQCRQAMAPVTAFQRMKPQITDQGAAVAWEEAPLLSYDEAERRCAALPEAWKTQAETKILLTDVYAGNGTLREFVGQLSDTELAQLMRGEGMGSPRVTAGTASAFGGVTDALTAYGIPAACCSDGPSGMRLDCGTKAFSLPNGTMLAACFNTDLLTELFTLVGAEMAANKVDCLLGPGMNIHRHPLNGRNFEYFSEDPYLTGMSAAAELKGLHATGVTGVIKHCCGNNQETNRHFLNDTVSERALREIYLRGFQYAAQAGADAIMTTYGAVNGLWTAGNYDLCTEILRNEYGFRGIIMTDWWANINSRGCAPDRNHFAEMVRAQNDLYMVCADCETHEDDILSELHAGTLTRGELQRNAVNICGFLLRTNAMKRLAGEDTAVEIVNRPAEETDDGAPVVFYEMEEELTVDLHDIDTARGTNHAFAVTVNQPGWFEVTVTASCDQSDLAQIPMTLFSMGTAFGTFTWNGTHGEAVSYTKKMPLFSHFTTMRLYFAQSGLTMHSLHFKRLSGDFDVSAIAETEE
ncbi:MAG: glycoside hydrolase family 3 protein [Oscillospiraceae bacterium]|nr:glycoside hydrolase family 3 protein [Oscillospiraceae bacterium]